MLLPFPQMDNLMKLPIRMPWAVQELLRCPVCKSRLNLADDQFICAGPGCGAVFPVLDGVPVLINEDSSVFAIADFTSRRSTTFDLRRNKVLEALIQLAPSISKNIKAKHNYEKLATLLLDRSATPRVLVVGGSILGEGMASLAQNPPFELVDTDVSFGPRTMLICDAHDIPFQDESFDGVIAQAVLEHVVDPYRCVEEIHRVLKKDGLVYAETPFMQQVHLGRYDFTRFTHLGHRRLFRRFEEIDSGAVCGPGMALAWSYQYFLLSFARSKALRALIRAFASLTSFYLKYFDYFLIDTAGGLDAASGHYFTGRKSGHSLPDKELIKLYKGAISQ
jgi:SAM-dependent methyltransferase